MAQLGDNSFPSVRKGWAQLAALETGHSKTDILASSEGTEETWPTPPHTCCVTFGLRVPARDLGFPTVK